MKTPLPDGNAKEFPVLTLSLSHDGALQQMLRDSSGNIQVGETDQFCNDWLDSANPAVLRSPIAPRVMQAILQLHSPLVVLAPDKFVNLPWETWLGTRVVWRDSETQKNRLISEQERSYRNVVSLSYDIVNSTAMMAELGIENYYELIKKLHARFSQVSLDWHGRSDLSQGDDGCMCYFGADHADEHAAQFAMEAAYEMQLAAASNGWPVRIGLAQGWVAIESGQPVGLSVHMAARVQKAAHPAAVWLTQDIQAKLADRWIFAKVHANHELKGFSNDTVLAQLMGPITTPHRLVQPFKDKNQSIDHCIGRDVELQTLVSAWQKVLEGVGQDCLVHGVAGIGKSTLLRHALRRINASHVLHLRANPHDARVAFGTLRASIALEFGIAPHVSKQDQLDSLNQRLLEEPKLRKYEFAIQDLFELSKSRPQFEEPQAEYKNTLQAMLHWAIDKAHAEPFVILIDDYQWADAATQEWALLIKRSLGADFPLLLIISERTSEMHSPKYAEPRHDVALQPLGAAHAQELIGKIAPKLSSNPHWVAVLQARARGVPLFLRETAILFDSAEQQKKIDQAQKLGRPLDVPATLQDLLLQRLDQLGEYKKIAQTASILGQEFIWQDVLDLHRSTQHEFSLTDDQLLQELLSSGVWIKQFLPATSSESSQRLSFSHAMLGDVAYQSMWESDRRKLHTIAAQMLAEKRSQDPFLVTQLARHWAAAGETVLAIDQLLAAGKASKKRGVHDIAVQCMEAALQLLYTQELIPETIQKRIDAHLALSGQIMITQGYAANAVHEHSLQAVELSRTLNDPKALLRSQLSLQSIYFMRGDFADAHRLLNESLVTAAQVNHPLTTLQHQWACGNLAFYEGDFVATEQIMDGCVKWCNDHSLGKELIQNPKVLAQMYRAYSLWCLGRVGDAIEAAKLGCEWAQAGSHRLTRLQSHGIAAMVYYGCGLWQETLESAENAASSCEQSEYALWLAHAGFMRGAALARLGHYQNGIEQMRLHHAQWAASGGILTRSYYWTIEAEILRNNRDTQVARQTIRQAKEMVMKIPERYYISEVRRISACLQWDAANDIEAKLAAYEQLVEAYRDASHRRAWGLAFRVASSMLEYCNTEPTLIGLARHEQADANLLECVKNLQPSASIEVTHSRFNAPNTANVITLEHLRKTAA